MSSQPKEILPSPYDPKYLDLVRKISEKTRAKKITWNKTSTGMNASVSGKMQLGFVRSLGTFVTPEKWALFTIRDENGNEILSVTNTSTLAMLAGPTPPSPEHNLRKSIGHLFDAVEESTRAEVEKLIEVVDRI